MGEYPGSTPSSISHIHSAIDSLNTHSHNNDGEREDR